MGTARPLSVVTALHGVWGPFPVHLSYQWFADGEPVKGATAPVYLVRTADRGAVLTVEVTGTKDGYTTTSRTSDGTKVGR